MFKCDSGLFRDIPRDYLGGLDASNTLRFRESPELKELLGLFQGLLSCDRTQEDVSLFSEVQGY